MWDVGSTPESYLELRSDIDALRKLPNYLAIPAFSEPPKLSDLSGFTLDKQDIQELKNCEPSHCEIQLPTEAIEVFQRAVDWSATDITGQVNRSAQKMAFETLMRYEHDGDAALDRTHPSVVADTFQSLLDGSKALPVYLPELKPYLLDYPNAESQQIQSKFFGRKWALGLKPTLRVVQAIVDRRCWSCIRGCHQAVVCEPLFRTALDLTVCVPDVGSPQSQGFCLITLNGSQQAGLTGLQGGLVRKVAVDKTRSSLEHALAAIRRDRYVWGLHAFTLDMDDGITWKLAGLHGLRDLAAGDGRELEIHPLLAILTVMVGGQWAELQVSTSLFRWLPGCESCRAGFPSCERLGSRNPRFNSALC